MLLYSGSSKSISFLFVKMNAKTLKNIFICVSCLVAAVSAAFTYINPKTAEAPEDFIVFYDVEIEEPTVENGKNIGAETYETDSDGKISINNADLDELMTLPHIGEVKAKAIIAYREEYGAFVCIEELTEVRGIGDATLEKLKDFIKL